MIARFFVIVFSLAVGLLLAVPAETNALGLKAAPLEYKATLKKDERKRGFIDVSNPYGQPLKVQVTVQAFKQIDNDGGLQFYDDEQFSAGITPELKTVDLGAREAARIFFTVDGSKLPEGDVYGAIFFSVALPQPRNGVGQSIRVGTLLSIVNGTPGPRQAEITRFAAPFFQLSDKVEGSYRVKNTASSGGFYPAVKVSSWPGGKPQTKQSSLLFAGRERENDVTYVTGYGIHLVEISYGNSKKSQWIITMAPWMLVLIALVGLIVFIELLLLKRRRKAKSNSASL